MVSKNKNLNDIQKIISSSHHIPSSQSNFYGRSTSGTNGALQWSTWNGHWYIEKTHSFPNFYSLYIPSVHRFSHCINININMNINIYISPNGNIWSYIYTNCHKIPLVDDSKYTIYWWYIGYIETIYKKEEFPILIIHRYSQHTLR